MDAIEVREGRPADAEFVRRSLMESMAGTAVAGHGELIDAMRLAALVAWIDDEPVGHLTYRQDPPSTSPPASTPPASTPPTWSPPASTPPAWSPPGSSPPASTPPASTPPASTPPGWEVVTLHAARPGRGVGAALMAALLDRARQAGAARVWLITTNDNTNALRFYQRLGFDLVRLDRDAVTEARRRLKPTIATHADGIPIRHELELEWLWPVDPA
jgi:GNAT superfamily N-acetyltransferase